MDLKERLEKNFLASLKNDFGVTAEKATAEQIHSALGAAVMAEITENWDKSKAAHRKNKRACYFSMEFLVGRAVFNNIMTLGIEKEVSELLANHGKGLSDLEEIEDAALGNGGLGRLAACFLESAATTNIPLDGYGIRYKYGLFKQSFEDGFQKESADDWTKHGDAWSRRVEADEVIVEYADQKVRAVPYDMPIIGFKTKNISTLRLWQAEAVQSFDFELFNKQEYINASASQILAEDISKVLYPNDDNEAGKILRIKQEYFFTCASITDILKKHIADGNSLSLLHEKIFIQLNDTHPVFAIPELIRQLVDVYGLSFDAAFATALRAFAYTNHTVMAEALEKWSAGLVRKILPRIYEIIFQINELFMAEMYAKGLDRAHIDRIKIIANETVHMANLAIFVSSCTNGVAMLHTEILKDDALKDWYTVYPERFQNKTNGITPRRWIGLCNKELSELITESLSSDEWLVNLDRLAALKSMSGDKQKLAEFAKIKLAKKTQLAEYIKTHEGIEIDPTSIFDIQIKRLHEYKRQLLNAFGILYIYYGIKEKRIKDFYPTTFIFGAKAAPGYARAKAVIKFINEIARLVNDDPETNKLIKVVFVQNYNVSYAEKLVCAADVSEQISTAGTEASGTGNMKLMLNGTVTLGTYDGANVEIVAEAGEENNYIFGARVEQLPELMKNYDPRKILERDENLRKAVSALIDGTVSDGGNGSFRELYTGLLEGASWHKPDHYYVIGDLLDYVNTKLRLNRDYSESRDEFMQKCWINMAKAGKFSSDRTIREYAAQIWHIGEVQI